MSYPCGCYVESDMFSYKILNFRPCDKHDSLMEPELDILQKKLKEVVQQVVKENFPNLPE